MLCFLNKHAILYGNEVTELTTVSERIKKGMEIRNIKQAELAGMTGISKGALSSYLSGRYVPKQNNIYLIAEALHVNAAWLMGHDAPMEHSKAAKNITDYYYEKLNAVNKANADKYIKNLYDMQSMQAENELLLNAAHERTDIPVTDEMRAHDNDIMNDENF